MKIKYIEMMEGVVQSSKPRTERLQSVIQLENIFVVQSGDSVEWQKSTAIVRNASIIENQTPKVRFWFRLIFLSKSYIEKIIK